MTDTVAYQSETPELPSGEARGMPSSDVDLSPLGEARQYQRAPRLPSLHNQASLTGATPNDPGRELSAQPLLEDPDWASPLRGIRLVLQGYAESWLLYWMGYGFFLLLGLGLTQSLLSHADPLTPGQVGIAFCAGPLYGFILDIALIASNSPAAVLGVLLLALEPVFALLIIFTQEPRARIKYCSLVFGLVLVKAVVYVWVNRSL